MFRVQVDCESTGQGAVYYVADLQVSYQAVPGQSGLMKINGLLARYGYTAATEADARSALAAAVHAPECSHACHEFDPDFGADSEENTDH